SHITRTGVLSAGKTKGGPAGPPRLRRDRNAARLAASLDDDARGGRPAEENGVDVAPRGAGDVVEPVAERVEEVARIGIGGRRLADRDVVAEPGRADVAPRRDVRHEISPESHHVVLVAAVAAVLEGEPDLAAARVGR